MIKWDFSGRTVAVTGGTGGLGLALTKAYIESGAKVYLCGLDDAKYAAAAQELASSYGDSDAGYHMSVVDVTDIAGLRSWFETIVERERRIDVLVNAAGICSTIPAHETDELLWDSIVDVNMKGTFFACQLVGETMKAAGYGRIVNISSIGAYNGGTLVSLPYSASKAGVLTLTKSFAGLYGKHGICVNAVSPGPFQTEMISDFTEEGLNGMISRTPTGRIGQPEDVVSCVLFLSDETSSHINGSALDINGGLYMR